MSDEFSTTSAEVLRVGSLRERETRARVTAELHRWSELPAPIKAQQLEQVAHFDAAVRVAIDDDLAWFFANPTELNESAFARECVQFHRRMAAMFEGLLERRAEWSDAETDSAVVHTTAWALWHCGQALKWSGFRAEPLPAAVWSQAHKLFHFAELSQIHRLDLSAEHTRLLLPTIEAGYVHLLVLDALSTGNLGAHEIEIADHWLAKWRGSFSVDALNGGNAAELGFEGQLDSSNLADAPVAGQGPTVDLDGSAGLQFSPLSSRSVNATTDQGLRTVVLRDFSAQLDAARDSLRVGQPYAAAGFCATFPIEHYANALAAFEKLAPAFVGNASVEFDQRHQVSDAIAQVFIGFAHAHSIASGEAPKADNSALRFGDIALTLDGDTSSMTSTATDLPALEMSVRDQSANGIGLLCTSGQVEGVQLGSLVSFRLPPSQRWTLGAVVRKQAVDFGDQFLLGVELLGPLTRSLALEPASTDDSGFADAASTLAAIYLPGRDPTGRGDALLLAPYNFDAQNLLSTSVGEDAYMLRINRVARKGEGWIALRFEVVATS